MLEDMEHTSRHVVPSERILGDPWVDNDRGPKNLLLGSS